jgi:hypothetical protein
LLDQQANESGEISRSQLQRLTPARTKAGRVTTLDSTDGRNSLACFLRWSRNLPFANSGFSSPEEPSAGHHRNG